MTSIGFNMGKVVGGVSYSEANSEHTNPYIQTLSLCYRAMVTANYQGFLSTVPHCGQATAEPSCRASHIYPRHLAFDNDKLFVLSQIN